MRRLQIILVALVAISSLILGIFLIVYPVITFGISAKVFQPVLLKTFFMPGIVFTIIGSINLAAFFAGVHRSGKYYYLSISGGIAIIVWGIIETIILQSITLVYLTFLFCGLLILILSWKSKNKWTVECR